MQKVINILAIVSFAVSATTVIGVTYVYMNKDSIADGVRKNVTKAATEAITDALPDLLDGAMPEMPTETGAPLPLPLP